MSGIFPNEAASAENFSINDAVMHSVNSKEIAKQIGRVVDIDKKANKVWVQFPIGDKMSIDPQELIIATEAMGKCVVPPVEGVVSDAVKKSAESVAAKKANVSKEDFENSKMAFSVARRFATDKVERLCSDIVLCKEAGKNEMEAYHEIFTKYASTCSDDFIRGSIEKLYEDIS